MVKLNYHSSGSSQSRSNSITAATPVAFSDPSGAVNFRHCLLSLVNDQSHPLPLHPLSDDDPLRLPKHLSPQVRHRRRRPPQAATLQPSTGKPHQNQEQEQIQHFIKLVQMVGESRSWRWRCVMCVTTEPVEFLGIQNGEGVMK